MRLNACVCSELRSYAAVMQHEREKQRQCRVSCAPSVLAVPCCCAHWPRVDLAVICIPGLKDHAGGPGVAQGGA